MTTLDVLKAARALISDPARWNQRFWARNEQGVGCLADDPQACAWCAAGAVNKVTLLPGQYVARGDALAELDDAIADTQGTYLLSEPLIFNYNDTHTHAEVLALFDAAIKGLEQEVGP